jgi:hypothetical protein
MASLSVGRSVNVVSSNRRPECPQGHTIGLPKHCDSAVADPRSAAARATLWPEGGSDPDDADEAPDALEVLRVACVHR